MLLKRTSFRIWVFALLFVFANFSISGAKAGVKIGDAPPKAGAEQPNLPGNPGVPNRGSVYPDQDETRPVYRYNAGTYYFPQSVGPGYSCGAFQGYPSPYSFGNMGPGIGLDPRINNNNSGYLNTPPRMRTVPGDASMPYGPGFSSGNGFNNIRPVTGGQYYPGYGFGEQNQPLNPPPRMRDTPYTYTNSLETNSPPRTLPARIQINVPTANAEVLVEGVPMTSTGLTRQFVSPPLPSGTFHYEIVVRWTQDGKMESRTRNITVRSGERYSFSIAE